MRNLKATVTDHVGSLYKSFNTSTEHSNTTRVVFPDQKQVEELVHQYRNDALDEVISLIEGYIGRELDEAILDQIREMKVEE